LRRLKATLNDARDVASVLGNPKIGNFTVTSISDQPSSAIAEAIERFCAVREPNDTVVLYFTGHGITDTGGRLYLTACNTNRDLPRSTAISDSFLRDTLRTCRAQRQVLILDCCFGGAIAKEMLSKSGDDDSIDFEASFGGVGAGRVILTASSANEYAFEDNVPTPTRRSVFTKIVVNGLRTGAADVDGDGQITTDDLYNYAFGLIAIPGSRQTPTRTGVAIKGNIVIARCQPRQDARRAPKLQQFVRIHDGESEGTGAALAAITAMEAYLASRGHKTRLSARYVHEKILQLSGGDGAGGQTYDLVVRVLEEFGACPESAWPHVPNKRELPAGTTMEQLDELARPYRARLSRMGSIEEVASQLEARMPVLAGIEIDKAFDDAMTGNGGVIEASTNHDETMRGITLITLTDFDSATGVIGFATTWGIRAGNKGFGSMTTAAAEVMLVPDQIWSLSIHDAPGLKKFNWKSTKDPPGVADR
jgi:hypothetical protein